MKRIKTSFILVLLCFLAHYAAGQKRSYIATDSSQSVGFKLIRSTPVNNSQYILHRSKGQEIKYTPNDIIEYGFNDGTIYVSKNITLDGQEKKVFLERLEEGKITLYYYVDGTHRTFYIENDSSGLKELKRDKEAFMQASKDCKYISDALRLSSYTKSSLRNLVVYYNDCNQKPFPYTKMGVSFGIRRTSLKIPSNIFNTSLEAISFSPSSSLSFGLFADLPINTSFFSINSGVYFTKVGYSENSHKSHLDTDVVINLSSIHVPVLLRYTLPTAKLRPFFDFGPNFIYNVENSSGVFQSSVMDKVVVINKFWQDQLVSDYLIGFSVGAGLQYNYNYKNTISTEIRHSTSYGRKGTLNLSGLDLIVGFSF